MLPFLSRSGEEKWYFCRCNMRSVLEAVVDCERACSLNNFVLFNFCLLFVLIIGLKFTC